MVVDDTLDLTLALKVADGNAGKRAVDLQTVNEHTGGDHLEGGNLLEDTLIERLVKGNGILGLVLNTALRPLLLLAGLRRRGENGRLLRGHLLSARNRSTYLDGLFQSRLLGWLPFGPAKLLEKYT